MNELQVITQQTPGSITWNFEELKAQLTEEMKQYESLVYTDANIKEAKSDVAGLRKLQKEVDARRIEIKKACLAPYEVFENQASELKAIIEKPIAVIDEKVKDYEARRKESVLQKIREYFAAASECLPEQVREKAFGKIYTDKWLNATTAAKVWKDGIDTGVSLIVRDYDTLHTMASDFVAEGITEYEKNLNLNDAIQYMNALQRQKQIAEERVAEEQRRKEEAARLEAERKMQEEQKNQNVANNAPEGSNPQSAPEPKEESTAPETNAPCGENEAKTDFMIRLFSKEDLLEVAKYCKFSEIRYEVQMPGDKGQV